MEEPPGAHRHTLGYSEMTVEKEKGGGEALVKRE